MSITRSGHGIIPDFSKLVTYAILALNASNIKIKNRIKEENRYVNFKKYFTVMEIFQETLKSNQTGLNALFYTSSLQMPGIKLLHLQKIRKGYRKHSFISSIYSYN